MKGLPHAELTSRQQAEERRVLQLSLIVGQLEPPVCQ